MSFVLPNPECRAAVLQSMVQALSVKHGPECLGTEEDRRLLANLGPEERFRALQIEFVGLAYRLETREMEIREALTQLSGASKEVKALKMMQTEETRLKREEEIIEKYKHAHAASALKLHTALEKDRMKLKSAIDADLLHHLPRQQAVTLEELLLAAGAKAKNTSTRSRLHALLAQIRESQPLYPAGSKDDMVKTLQAFVKDNAQEFDAVKAVPAAETTLPWDTTVGGKRKKHPVDKVWDSAMERCHP